MRDGHEQLFERMLRAGSIRPSTDSYKVKFYIERAKNSLLIAEHHKDKQPTQEEASKQHWTYWAITISYYAMLYAAKAANLTKGYETKDHLATQIALEKLFVPDELEREDLELLEQAHKILEEEYITSFEQARKESYAARYAATKTYTERRTQEIHAAARMFITKIRTVIEQ